jgi:hypothetical protein
VFESKPVPYPVRLLEDSVVPPGAKDHPMEMQDGDDDTNEEDIQMQSLRSRVSVAPRDINADAPRRSSAHGAAGTCASVWQRVVDGVVQYFVSSVPCARMAMISVFGVPFGSR